MASRANTVRDDSVDYDAVPSRVEASQTGSRQAGRDEANPDRRKSITGANLATAPRRRSRLAIPRIWLAMGPVMVACGLLEAMVTGYFPPTGALVLIVVALALVAMTPLARRLDSSANLSVKVRAAAGAVGVGLPMLLYGVGLALWAQKHYGNAGPPNLSVALLAALVAVTFLSGRHAAMLAALAATWLGPLIVLGEPIHFVIFAIGIGFGCFVIVHRMRDDVRAETQRGAMDRVQRRAEELLAEYERAGMGWFWETDRRGAITYVSPTIERVLRKAMGELVGRPFTGLFILAANDQEGERTLNFHLSARSSFQELAVRAATAQDDERWWSISGRPIFDSFDNFIGFRGSGSDLTEKRRSQESASRLAHYDSLTGLANRFQMSETLEKILNAQREDHRTCSVYLIDLDRFKQVNDTMGHPAGDALLKQVSQRLEHTVRDAGRVGRLGGDEFQVILPGAITRDDLAHLAQRVIANLSQPYIIDGHRVVIGASLGIAMSPDHGTTSEELIRNADLALYAAKDGGRGRHHFYAEDLHSDAEERRKLEQDLRDALSNGDLELHYQPVVHTTTERITGFEALLRWNHPVAGMLSPAKFVPIAEDAGLIGPIGEWALRKACEDLASFPESVRVAVNVSPLQFANPALPAIVTSALAAAGVDPARLELEITESVFLNDDSTTEAMFAALKRVGVRLALDDFGTGYSSLGYLKKAPFDKIKIDQSFVRGATIAGSRNGAIIASIVSLAEALNMETTAEGVETLDELDLVRMLGCSHIQGFIYEKPLPPEAARTRLAEGLVAIARGHKSARSSRQTMLRKVVLRHGSESYDGTIRNISTTGALVEGLWNVPPGTTFELHLSRDQVLCVVTRWCKDDRMGIEFSEPLEMDAEGRISIEKPMARPRSSDGFLMPSSLAG